MDVTPSVGARATSIAISSTAPHDVDGNGTNETYGGGDAVELEVTFDKAVWVTKATETTDGVELPVGPRIAVRVGSATDYETKYAVYASGSGTTKLTFTYEVADGDADTDGIAVAANALTLNGGTIRRGSDADAEAAALAHAAVAASASHKVDGGGGERAVGDGELVGGCGQRVRDRGRHRADRDVYRGR